MRVEPVRPLAVAEQPPDALAGLTRRDVDKAYRLAWAILGNDEDAQDATQDALTVAWQHRSNLRDPGKAEAWRSRVLINTCRDRLRSRASPARGRWTFGSPMTLAFRGRDTRARASMACLRA